MSDRLRCENGNRSFAWLEFEDERDGVAFTFGLQGAGWKNLLLDLNPSKDASGATVYSDDNRGLLVRAFQTPAKHEQAVLWTPGDADPFTEQPGRERYAAPAPDGSGPYRTFCGT